MIYRLTNSIPCDRHNIQRTIIRENATLDENALLWSQSALPAFFMRGCDDHEAIFC